MSSYSMPVYYAVFINSSVKKKERERGGVNKENSMGYFWILVLPANSSFCLLEKISLSNLCALLLVFPIQDIFFSFPLCFNITSSLKQAYHSLNPMTSWLILRSPCHSQLYSISCKHAHINVSFSFRYIDFVFQESRTKTNSDSLVKTHLTKNIWTLFLTTPRT